MPQQMGRALWGDQMRPELRPKMIMGAPPLEERPGQVLLCAEPPVGIEPTTCSLRVNRSAD